MVNNPSHVMRSKWNRYDQRLREDDGDGSLVGASFIIAKSGVTDVRALLDRLDAAEKALGTAMELIAMAYVGSVDPRCADFMCDRDAWRALVGDEDA